MDEPGGSPQGRPDRTSGVGPVEDRHNAEVAVFFREAWGSDSTEEEVAQWRAAEARENPVDPGREPPKWVFTKGGQVLGYLGTIPTRFFVEGREFASHWLKGLWVLPQYRGGPVGFAVLQQAMADLGPAASSVVAEPARRILEAQGLRDRGTLFNRLRLLRPTRLLRRLDLVGLGFAGMPRPIHLGVGLLKRTRTTALAGAALSSATAIAVALRGRPKRRLRLTSGWSSVTEEDLDEAWARFKSSVRASSVRDGSLMYWRYARGPEYQICAAWDCGKLRAWSIIRRPIVGGDSRLKGVSIASLSDVLYPPQEPGLGLAVVAGAERMARAMNADGILCSGTHPALEGVLARRGFKSIPANLHFLARDWHEDVFADPLTEWWLTRGDARSDESF